MRLAAALAVSLLLASPLRAWTPATDERIATKAARLAPPDVRLLIDNYRDEYLRGIREAGRNESGDQHYFYADTGKGRLRKQLETEVNNAISVIRSRKPMPTFVYRLGVIAHLVSDANNPFHTAASDQRLDATCRSDFESYAESRLTAFPTVFYGMPPDLRLGSYLDETLSRASRLYPLLGEEFFRFGTRRSPSEFDDRSTAFGVASVSYSHAVTDLANLYYFIWKEAGGDVRSMAAMRSGTLLLNEAAAKPEPPFLGRTGEQ